MKYFYPPRLGLSLALLFSPFASAKTQTVDVVGDSVSVTLTEAGTLRETLIDTDVSLSSIKRLRVAGPINSKELNFFAEKTVSDLETIDLRDVEPVYDDEKYASVNVGREGGIIMSFLFSDKQTVTYTGSISNGMFAYTRDLYDARVNDLSAVFSSYKNLKTLMLPKWLTRAGAYLADECEKLTNVVLPSSVTSIGCGAFYECSSLEGLSGVHVSEVSNGSTFAYTALKNFYWDKLKKIGGGSKVDSLLETCVYFGAFYNTSLTYADLSGIDSIPRRAFGKCGKLCDVVFSKNVKYLGVEVFYGTALKKVGDGIFPNLSYVGESCFSGTPFQDDQLKTSEGIAYLDKFALNFKSNGKQNYEIKEGITSICDNFSGNGYYNSYEEQKFTLPSTIKYIGKEAFKNAKLIEINLPEGLEYIGERAFENQKITSITIPFTLKFVGEYAFYDIAVEKLTIPDNNCVYDGHAFYSPKLVKLDYYYNVTEDSWLSFSSCSNLTVVNIGANVSHIPGGFLSGTKISRVNIEEHDASTPFRIGGSAFENCKNLEKIVLPSTTDCIGGYAFSESSLKELKLPDNVKYIGEYAFERCPLQEVTFPSSVNYIGSYAFQECPLNEVNLPNTVAYVGNCAFSSDAIKKVTIPEKVANFDSYPFYKCKNVTDVTFNGIPDNGYVGYWFSFPNGVANIAIGPNVSYIPGCFQYFAGTDYKTRNLTFAPRDKNSPALTLGEGSLYRFGMTRLELPEGTETIEDRAIGNCKYLRVATIPSTVKRIVGKLFNYYECESCLDTIYCFIPCDLDITEVGFGGEKVNGKTVLCVLPEYLDDYKADYRFRNYEIIAMPEDHIPVGIENAVMGSNTSNVEAADIDAIFDTKGRRVESLRPGLNIVRTKDGRMVKVMSR